MPNLPRGTLSTELVEDVQRTERLAVIGAAMDEVIGPDVVATLWSEADAGSVIDPKPPLLWLFRWHLEPLPPPYPFDTAVADLPANASQQRHNATVAVTTVLPHQLDHVRHKSILIFPAPWLIFLR